MRFRGKYQAGTVRPENLPVAHNHHQLLDTTLDGYYTCNSRHAQALALFQQWAWILLQRWQALIRIIYREEARTNVQLQSGAYDPQKSCAHRCPHSGVLAALRRHRSSKYSAAEKHDPSSGSSQSLLFRFGQDLVKGPARPLERFGVTIPLRDEL